MEFIKKGKDQFRKGLVHDEKGELKDALTCYQKGIDLFLTGVKYIKEENIKVLKRNKCIYAFPRNKSHEEEDALKDKIIKKSYEKCREFLKRAEEIKKFLEKGEDKKDEKKSKGPKKKGPKKNVDMGKDKKKNENLTEDQKRLRDSIEDAVLKEKPNVKWEDVAGMEVAKKAIEEALVLPQMYPQLFVGKRKPWKCVLLYGPPGTGKSYLAKAVATRISKDMTFFSVSSSNLVSKWLGESERLVRTLFEMALSDAPSIVFIDEVDSLCGKRESGDSNDSSHRIKTEFLVQLQKVMDSKKICIVLAATNREFDLDPAMRRRFEKRIYIALPEFAQRKAVLKVHARKDFNLSDKEYAELATQMKGFSCADISIVVRDALMQPVRVAMKCRYWKKHFNGNNELVKITLAKKGDDGITEMTLLDFDNEESKVLELPIPNIKDLKAAIKNTPPSVSKSDIAEHEKWTKEFGIEG